MEVKKVTKKLLLSKFELVKYQLLVELVFFKKEVLTSSDLELLSLLALWGPLDLKSFCDRAASIVYKDTDNDQVKIQNVRNRMVALERRSFVTKTKKGKKMVELNAGITIHKSGNILIEHLFASVSKPVKTTADEPIEV